MPDNRSTDCYSAELNQSSNSRTTEPTGGLIPVDDAIQRLLEQAQPLTESKLIAVLEANGRVLAKPVVSTVNVPPADNSAMDGYAVNSADLAAEGEVSLPVSQRICAGQSAEPLANGTTARIFTGAPIPAGADAVIMQERCEQQNNVMTTEFKPKPGDNVRRAGEDIKSGDTILETGHRIRPQDMGLIASVGVEKVSVYRRLKVAIFFTGDELREPGTVLQNGQIYNSNRYTLNGLLQRCDCEIIDFGIVEDTRSATIDTLKQAAQAADLVLTSGGVSVGEEDHVRAALETIGTLQMWRIKMKPGKPFTLGQISSTPFIGLPGNPVSVFATFCLFARPFILKRQGCDTVLPTRYRIKAAFEWKKKGPRAEFLRARLAHESTGFPVLTIYPNQGSGVLSSTSWADGFACIPPETEINFGEMVEFVSFNDLFN